MINTTNIEKEPESQVMIRFSDCDPMGHLNNARYIDYFINAREDQLLAYYGVDFHERGKDNNEGWYISKAQIAYLTPAMLREEITVKSRLIMISDKAIRIEAMMLDEQKRRLKALAWMDFTWVDTKTGRSKKHPEDLLQFYLNIRTGELYREEDFEERIKTAKIQLRKQAAIK